MKTNKIMVEQAELHVGAFLTTKERQAIAESIPNDVFMADDQTYVEAMVIGFGVAKTLSDTINSCMWDHPIRL